MATLTQIKKTLTADDCTNTRRIMQMFVKICQTNPDVVKTAFGDYLKRGDAPSQSRMVAFYEDNANYLADLFNYE